MKGRELKKLIQDTVRDDDIVCLGERNDTLGRFDRKIIGVETRNVGFDKDNTYKAIISEKFDSTELWSFGDSFGEYINVTNILFFYLGGFNVGI